MARPRRRPLLSGLLTFAIIAALETLSVLAMHTDLRIGPMVDMLLAFAFHLGAATMLSYGFWGAWDFRHADEKNWAVVGFVMVLAVPIYGLIGFSFAFAAVHWRRRLALSKEGGVIESFEKYIAYEPEERSELGGMNLLTDALNAEDLERKGKVAPLIDIIKSGDPELKRGAIFSISKLKPQTAVKILRESLRDVDPDSQFFVAGQLARIEKQLSEQIIRTRRRLELTPTDLELKVELARYGKEYVLSGLLDPSVEQYFLRQSIALCEEVVLTSPERLDVLIDLADLLVRARDIDGAVAGYGKCAEGDRSNTNAWVGLALCYYEKRDLLRLGVVLEELKSRGELPASLHDVLAFWDVARPA
jgi:hypothetical protein